MSVQLACAVCTFQDADLLVVPCGCSFHARCVPITQSPLSQCPACNMSCSTLRLVPMSFQELDAAQNDAKKAKNGKIHPKRASDLNSSIDDTDCRIGRWTQEETQYVDEIIRMFESGCLPLQDNMKLNDFLARLLKCKQSRLTKKMKNAKLSSRAFRKTSGFIPNTDARNISNLEHLFFRSIVNDVARAEIRFHMQKEWRELFSKYCVKEEQALDADSWLSSVEELERRVSIAKDAARHKRRKLMIKYSSNRDGAQTLTNNSGMLMDSHELQDLFSRDDFGVNETSTTLSGGSSIMGGMNVSGGTNLGQSSSRRSHLPSFLSRVVDYLERSSDVPFEHVDLWVPSYSANNGGGSDGAATSNQQVCKLCFAGCATAELGPSQQEEQNNLLAFGQYSERFSFSVGSGLPGRVYQSGIPTWEQSVHNAPTHHFERAQGALRLGIKTVCGFPVPSPNVGMIVVVLYSCHDRQKDANLVGRLCEEFTRYQPTPKWKLTVELGPTGQENSGYPRTNHNSQMQDSRIEEVIKLVGEHIPTDPNSPLASFAPGFMKLRLMLLNHNRNEQENEWVRILLDSYSSYNVAGRSSRDVASLVARDYMFLVNQNSMMDNNNNINGQNNSLNQQVSESANNHNNPNGMGNSMNRNANNSSSGFVSDMTSVNSPHIAEPTPAPGIGGIEHMSLMGTANSNIGENMSNSMSFQFGGINNIQTHRTNNQYMGDGGANNVMGSSANGSSNMEATGRDDSDASKLFESVMNNHHDSMNIPEN